MATYQKFNIFVEHLAKGVHDFSADTFKVYLSNAAPSASADSLKADMAEISAGNGYTAGGNTTTIGGTTQSGGTLTITATDPATWTASGGTIGPFQYAVLYNDTSTEQTDPLICWWDYGSAVTLQIGETFTVDIGASLFTLV